MKTDCVAGIASVLSSVVSKSGHHAYAHAHVHLLSCSGLDPAVASTLDLLECVPFHAHLLVVPLGVRHWKSFPPPPAPPAQHA